MIKSLSSCILDTVEYDKEINNNFTVTLSDSDGKAPANIKTVFLIFSNKQAGLGPISAELAKVGERVSNNKSIHQSEIYYS